MFGNLRRLALLLEYDGVAFAGSQLQPGRRTVQQVLEDAWMSFTATRIRAHFAGRTDAGVHARGQVAMLDTDVEHDVATVRSGLNHFLDNDLAVRSVVEVDSKFEPRRHALSRVYRYMIEYGRTRSPLSRTRVWQRRGHLDVTSMMEAADRLPLEECDWAAFGGRTAPDYPTVRTLHCSTVRQVSPHKLEYTIAADGFLPHQVRRTVGALVSVGERVLTPDDFVDLIDGPPSSVGPTAPPQGLTLLNVQYPSSVIDWTEGCVEAGSRMCDA